MRVDGPPQQTDEESNPDAGEADQIRFLTELHATISDVNHPIRQRLDRIDTASPDLLAIIKREGAV